MATVGDRYAKEIRGGLGYLASWLPNESMEVGQVGEIKQSAFVPRSHLNDLNIGFDVTPPTTKASLSHQSASGIEMNFKAKGDGSITLPGISAEEAGVMVKFTHRTGVVFQANGISQRRIKSLSSLEQAIYDRHLDGGWKSSWIVVDSIVEAESLTVLVSKSRKGELSLSGAAGLQSPVDLANVALGLEVKHRRDLATCIVADGPLTPLFTGRMLKPRILGLGKLEVESAFEPDSSPEGDGENDTQELALVPFDYPEA
jgi:hypothetical protein